MFCRVRPLLGDETLGNDGIIQHMNFPDPEQQTLELEKSGDATLNEVKLHVHVYHVDKIKQRYFNRFKNPSWVKTKSVIRYI